MKSKKEILETIELFELMLSDDGVTESEKQSFRENIQDLKEKLKAFDQPSKDKPVVKKAKSKPSLEKDDNLDAMDVLLNTGNPRYERVTEAFKAQDISFAETSFLVNNFEDSDTYITTAKQVPPSLVGKGILEVVADKGKQGKEYRLTAMANRALGREVQASPKQAEKTEAATSVESILNANKSNTWLTAEIAENALNDVELTAAFRTMEIEEPTLVHFHRQKEPIQLEKGDLVLFRQDKKTGKWFPFTHVVKDQLSQVVDAAIKTPASQKYMAWKTGPLTNESQDKFYDNLQPSDVETMTDCRLDYKKGSVPDPVNLFIETNRQMFLAVVKKDKNLLDFAQIKGIWQHKTDGQVVAKMMIPTFVSWLYDTVRIYYVSICKDGNPTMKLPNDFRITRAYESLLSDADLKKIYHPDYDYGKCSTIANKLYKAAPKSDEKKALYAQYQRKCVSQEYKDLLKMQAKANVDAIKEYIGSDWKQFGNTYGSAVSAAVKALKARKSK